MVIPPKEIGNLGLETNKKHSFSEKVWGIFKIIDRRFVIVHKNYREIILDKPQLDEYNGYKSVTMITAIVIIEKWLV